jgi:hypothetical protein
LSTATCCTPPSVDAPGGSRGSLSKSNSPGKGFTLRMRGVN